MVAQRNGMGRSITQVLSRTDMAVLSTADQCTAQLPGGRLDTAPNAPEAAVCLWDFLR